MPQIIDLERYAASQEATFKSTVPTHDEINDLANETVEYCLKNNIRNPVEILPCYKIFYCIYR